MACKGGQANEGMSTREMTKSNPYQQLDTKYKPGRILGRGSFGCARLVTCRASNKTMVAKEVKLDALSKREREKAQSEADLLRVCSAHPNVVTYIESFLSSLEGDARAGCSLHIVMDHCDGGDLGQLVDGKKKLGRPFSENEAMAILVQLNLALEHVHAQRILHRDIKAQNIFLTKAGVVKLGDFGIAKVSVGTRFRSKRF